MTIKAADRIVDEWHDAPHLSTPGSDPKRAQMHDLERLIELIREAIR